MSDPTPADPTTFTGWTPERARMLARAVAQWCGGTDADGDLAFGQVVEALRREQHATWEERIAPAVNRTVWIDGALDRVTSVRSVLQNRHGGVYYDVECRAGSVRVRPFHDDTDRRAYGAPREAELLATKGRRMVQSGQYLDLVSFCVEDDNVGFQP